MIECVYSNYCIKTKSKTGYGGANQHVGIETEGSSSRPVHSEFEASLDYMRCIFFRKLLALTGDGKHIRSKQQWNLHLSLPGPPSLLTHL